MTCGYQYWSNVSESSNYTVQQVEYCSEHNCKYIVDEIRKDEEHANKTLNDWLDCVENDWECEYYWDVL